jgi:2,5-furandicarboxylate decarboxylase 1
MRRLWPRAIPSVRVSLGAALFQIPSRAKFFCGKNALLALLSVAEVNLAIVTDDDIDINNPDDLDWAVTFRVQADRDLIVVQGARGKHIDPSIKSWELGKGGLPTTAKLGIDATIPEGVPKKLYRRIHVYGQDRAKPEDYR